MHTFIREQIFRDIGPARTPVENSPYHVAAEFIGLSACGVSGTPASNAKRPDQCRTDGTRLPGPNVPVDRDFSTASDGYGERGFYRRGQTSHTRKSSQKAILPFVSCFGAINRFRRLLNDCDVNHKPAMLRSDLFCHHPYASVRADSKKPRNTTMDLPIAKFPNLHRERAEFLEAASTVK
jgi:hypothetical protein